MTTQYTNGHVFEGSVCTLCWHRRSELWDTTDNYPVFRACEGENANSTTARLLRSLRLTSRAALHTRSGG